MRDKVSKMQEVVEQMALPYERPALTPVGNLYDVVAGTTQSLLCDAGIEGTDGDHATGC